MKGEQEVVYALYRMVTFPVTLSDPSHPKSSLFSRFGSSFMFLERLKLESPNFVHV